MSIVNKRNCIAHNESSDLFNPVFAIRGLTVSPLCAGDSSMSHHEQWEHRSDDLPCHRNKLGCMARLAGNTHEKSQHQLVYF